MVDNGRVIVIHHSVWWWLLFSEYKTLMFSGWQWLIMIDNGFDLAAINPCTWPSIWRLMPMVSHQCHRLAHSLGREKKTHYAVARPFLRNGWPCRRCAVPSRVQGRHCQSQEIHVDEQVSKVPVMLWVWPNPFSRSALWDTLIWPAVVRPQLSAMTINQT